MKLPSLNGLRVFEVVARLGSLTAAAQELHVTPSAISHQLKRLEEYLECKLLERTSKHVALTRHGETYYREISAVFEQIAVATDKLLRGGDSLQVSITATPVFMIKWLVKRLIDFYQRYPDIEVRINTSYRKMDLRKGAYDLGIRWGAGNWPGHQARRLMGDTVQPVCSPRLIPAGPPLMAAEFQRYPLIILDASRDAWQVWAQANGIDLSEPVRGTHFNEPTAAIQAAVDGLGLVLGTNVLVHDEIATGQLIAPFAEPVMLNEAFYLVYAEDGDHNPAAIKFSAWLAEACEAFERAQGVARLRLKPGSVNYPRSSQE